MHQRTHRLRKTRRLDSRAYRPKDDYGKEESEERRKVSRKRKENTRRARVKERERKRERTFAWNDDI